MVSVLFDVDGTQVASAALLAAAHEATFAEHAVVMPQ